MKRLEYREVLDKGTLGKAASVKIDKFYLREARFIAVCGMSVQTVLENNKKRG